MRFLLSRKVFPTSLAENGEIEIELSMTGKGKINHLYRGLRSHLETGGFSVVLGDIGNWENGVRQYLSECYNFLIVLMCEIESNRVKIPVNDVACPPKLGSPDMRQSLVR